MSKAAAHILLTAAFVLLTVQNLKPNHRARLPRGPNRRLGIKQRHQLFDPVVAQMTQESGLEDPNLATASWETTPFPREIPVGDLDRFLGEGKLNMTLRLMYLFPYVDKEPKDGFVEADELQAWILQQATDRLAYRTRKELAARDKNGDLEISLQECLPRLFEEDRENGIEEEEVRWWREQFNNADADKNEHLNFFELRDFLFPEDSNNEKIHAWLIREKIKTTDYDNDEKINLEEFKDGIFDMYTNYYEFENGEASLPTSEDLFEELDLNKDGLLVEEELISILPYLSPGEIQYAKFYASYLQHEADDDKDGKLTLQEMINHEYVFYNTVFEDNSDEDDDFHEEL